MFVQVKASRTRQRRERELHAALVGWLGLRLLLLDVCCVGPCVKNQSHALVRCCPPHHRCVHMMQIESLSKNRITLRLNHSLQTETDTEKCCGLGDGHRRSPARRCIVDARRALTARRHQRRSPPHLTGEGARSASATPLLPARRARHADRQSFAARVHVCLCALPRPASAGGGIAPR